MAALLVVQGILLWALWLLALNRLGVGDKKREAEEKLKASQETISLLEILLIKNLSRHPEKVREIEMENIHAMLSTCVSHPYNSSRKKFREMTEDIATALIDDDAERYRENMRAKIRRKKDELEKRHIILGDSLLNILNGVNTTG